MPGPSEHVLAVTRLMREAMMTQIVPFYGKLRVDQVSDNGFKDVATVADRQSEAFLFEGLTKLCPDCRLLGEETCKIRPETLANMVADHSFVVDSLDGTADFAAQKQGWGILIGERQGTRTVRGWILVARPTDAGWDSTVIAAERDRGIWILQSADGEFEDLPPRTETTLQRDERGRPVAIMHDELIVPEVLQPRILEKIAAGETAFAWRKHIWAGASIHKALILGELAAYVHGQVYPWDKAPGIDLMLGMVGGKAIALNDGKPFRLERMNGGIVGGTTPKFCDAARVDVCLPVEQTRGIEPGIPHYRLANPYDPEPGTARLEPLKKSSLRTSSP